MLDLSVLNREQREAVETLEGPLLILAGAGSGKTRVLTYRIANLIENGVYPGNILAITFTNKAAQEMKERIIQLVGDDAKNIWISTFHSACVRILRQDIDKIGYNKDFVIYDDGDQEKIVKECLKELNIDEKAMPPKDILSKIGSLKNELMDAETYYSRYGMDFKTRNLANIYKLYQKKLKKNNALDFDDIIMLTVKLFKQNQDVLNYYRRKFRYILVDEYQDTNRAQYEFVNILAKEHRNLCVVGDDDQCLLEGQMVLTSNGYKNIEQINENESVICAAGNGQIGEGNVSKVMKKEYDGVVVKVTTKGGRVIKATPNHLTFANLNFSSEYHIVYLMYKKGKGYRIGQTKGSRTRDEKIVNGMLVRINQEHGDKMWILKVCKDKKEATYYEQYFSIKYGIPTVVFHTLGRNMAMTQQQVDMLYKEIDTYTRAEKLMKENLLFEEYPHHMPNAVIRGGTVRKIINLNFFSGYRYYKDGYYGHRISLNTSGEDVKQKFISKGFCVRDGQRNTWRIETERKVYDDAEDFVKRLQQTDGDFEILRRAKLTENESLRFMPFSHLRPTMSIAVFENGKIVEDIVESVEFEHYKGYVYDLSVEYYRQYICNDVVVHNSIYGWRGADIRNILEFEKDFPEVKIIKLEQNYRCTKKILDAANYVIQNNEKRKQKRLWTQNEHGENIKFYKAETGEQEAVFIVQEIKRLVQEGRSLSDFAVLYRTNAMSRILEEAFVTSSVPYRVVGGLKFYDRKEIKDILAYLKVINNPLDSISLERIINVPRRGIGQTTIDRVKEYANEKDISLYTALLEVNNIEGINKRAAGAIEKFISQMNYFIVTKDRMTVSNLINEVLDTTGYIRELLEDNSKESQDRIENLNEFKSAAVEFEEQSEDKSLAAFLERIALVSDQDQIENADAVTLMTLHTAKGLEFNIVFIAGMEEGIFPHFSAKDDNDELEEERRLCYVGITRAKKQLYLTCAQSRLMYGRTMFNSVSSFIEEIPEHLVDDITPKKMSFNRVYGYDEYQVPKKNYNNC
ncbi:hypothetical protein TCEA9_18930 [Thermobrachium celere]|nr:hypothetical protein TCEA9_18930 [Thermobrachium celere]